MSMLLVSILSCCFGIHDYNRVLAGAGAPSDDDGRRKYEADSGHFAHYSNKQASIDQPLITRAGIALRTQWLGASAFCYIRGDPWLRSQRVFTVLLQVLLSLSLSCLFFQSAEAGFCATKVCTEEEIELEKVP